MHMVNAPIYFLAYLHGWSCSLSSYGLFWISSWSVYIIVRFSYSFLASLPLFWLHYICFESIVMMIDAHAFNSIMIHATLPWLFGPYLAYIPFKGWTNLIGLICSVQLTAGLGSLSIYFLIQQREYRHTFLTLTSNPPIFYPKESIAKNKTEESPFFTIFQLKTKQK